MPAYEGTCRRCGFGCRWSARLRAWVTMATGAVNCTSGGAHQVVR